MRTEDEIRVRLRHWREVLDGVLKGEETKKTISHIIDELEWVLGNEPPSYQAWKLSEENFADAYDLRDWGRDKLTDRPRQGILLLRRRAPDALEGSKVLLSRNGQIVVLATVKERPKSREPEVLPGVYPEYKKMVRFVPETIDAWDDDTFVSFKEARDLGINLPGGRNPYIKIKADEFHRIIALHLSKGETKGGRIR